MMTVYEYASDMNKTVDEVLNICKNLDINVNGEDDLLSDDDIILLDNEIENTESIDDDEETVEDSVEDVFDDSYEEELEEIKVTTTVMKKKKKNPKKEEKNVDDKDYAKQKKEMYKHKDKLISNINTLDDTIVLYTEGMSVSDFAVVCEMGGIVKDWVEFCKDLVDEE